MANALYLIQGDVLPVFDFCNYVCGYAGTAHQLCIGNRKTGCGMMDCKKALTNADGDMDKAVDFLREQGLAKQAKNCLLYTSFIFNPYSLM